MIDLQDLMDQYDKDKDGGEIKAVTKVGKLIAEQLNKHEWMQWTKFPDEFISCRTDADLYQAIDNYNEWITRITGLGKMPDPDDIIFEVEDLDDDDSE